MKYLIRSGAETQSLGLVLEPESCEEQASQIVDHLKIISINSSNLTDEQVHQAISLDSTALLLNV